MLNGLKGDFMTFQHRISGNVEEKIKKAKNMVAKDGIVFTGTFPIGTFNASSYGVSGVYSITEDIITVTVFPHELEQKAKKRIINLLDSI